ncbi:MAG: type II toxin-antitoxin system RelE/ParE family toxin [Candidatus Woesearchaeota archaeon]
MKPIFVGFYSAKLLTDFNLLQKGKFEDRKLHALIQKAIDELKKNPSCGKKIQKNLWPKEYKNIANLWKYNLSGSWRLLYTITEDEITILSIILEWLGHKNYEKRFGY